MTARSNGGLARYFLGLGTWGFGGPVALIGYMQRDLVERRAWFTGDEFRKCLALAQLAPGPLAAQMAMCLGYVAATAWGATLVGVAFVLPSFLMTVALGAAYVRLGGLAWMAAAFYGVGAVVIAIIARAAWRLGRLTNGTDPLLWALATAMAIVTAWTGAEIVWLFVLCGVVALMVRAPPRWLRRPAAAPALALPWQLFLFFAKAGAFVFGSGLAIVPFLHGGVVVDHHWLTERQFLDAVAVAMLTPGPVVITVAFIGYLLAGPAGATLAALGVFLPVYLFVVIPYRWFDRISENAQVKAFVRGVTAAAAGAIAGACIVLGRRALVDLPTVGLAIAALLALSRFRLPEPALIAVAAGVGLLIAPG